MARSVRSAAVAAACAAGMAAALSGAASSAQSTGQAGQPAPRQTPVFRASTNLVQVDAYPTRDGRIIEGLTVKDFQVSEDGKPQTIESVEFVRIEPNTPEAMRSDPNTQEEGNRLAADPRSRVFVIFLDHFHSSLAGSYATARPIVTMLNRLLTPTDLFGVATALMQPRELILGRLTTTIEDQLQRNWTWGLQRGVLALEPDEQRLVGCYGDRVALIVTDRTREDRTLASLSQFVRYLGALREARKALIVLSRGWTLYEPDQGTLQALLTPERSGVPQMGVATGGKLSNSPPNQPGMADWNWCATEVARAFNLDNRKRYRELIDEANRNNVAFYPVNTDGLASGERAETLMSLAENTDGLASMTNDFNAGLRRIADDVSAYYLLAYYPTNTKTDGAYRRIDVKVSAPGARVKARRGYMAPGADVASRREDGAAPKALVPAGVGEALDVLARLRPVAELFVQGVASASDIAVVVELPQGSTTKVAWEKGAEVQATVAAAAGDETAPRTARIEAGTRSAVVRLPRPAAPGPFRVTVKVTGTGAVLTDRLDVADRAPSLLGEPIVYRAAPAAQAPLRASADYQFWRTERVHVELPIGGPLDRREGRVLGRDGKALPVPVQITEREREGQLVVAADLGLSPLAAGDYVLEVVVARGGDEARRYVPLRVVR
jgi:VWFA-related protein